MVFGRYKVQYSIHGVHKPTYNWGHHLVGIFMNTWDVSELTFDTIDVLTFLSNVIL